VTRESWSAKGDVRELRKAYEGFHADVRAVLEACPDCHKVGDPRAEASATLERRTSCAAGRCLPRDDSYMAQGGATAIEDAAILARCLEEVGCEAIEEAFERYEAHRKPRTSRIQAISSANTWMKGGDEDTSWLYGYDAWNVPLTAPGIAVEPWKRVSNDPVRYFHNVRWLPNRIFDCRRVASRAAALRVDSFARARSKHLERSGSATG